MSRLQLSAHQQPAIPNAHIKITGSKSESNRLLILQQQFPNLEISNLSNSDDTQHLQTALRQDGNVLDIGHAGTAMRFLTAFLANQEGKKVTLTGSDRMKERPIGILVDALRYLGANITYAEKEGYPPLQIIGKKLKGGEVTMDGSVSSQYLSALLLIGSQMEKGLTLRLSGMITSRPYLEMTTGLLKDIGITVQEEENFIKISPQSHIQEQQMVVESDWSSAGYWYSWVALQPGDYSIKLSSYKKDSLQGDAQLSVLYEKLGVNTTFDGNQIVLARNTSFQQPDRLLYDLTHQPDQAQTIFATCIGLGIDLKLTGLHTLRIKETDRIEAMAVEGARFRESVIKTTTNTIEIIFPQHSPFNDTVTIDTYKDHRMALAFAPLCRFVQLTINQADVVSKSYADYWDDMRAVNVEITEI
jgi:3-phosphoshikimate 1-carboxyvinyltransferase